MYVSVFFGPWTESKAIIGHSESKLRESLILQAIFEATWDGGGVLDKEIHLHCLNNPMQSYLHTDDKGDSIINISNVFSPLGTIQ